MGKIFFILAFFFFHKIYCQDTLPHSRWFIKPHIIAGYNLGTSKNEIKSIVQEQPGFGYGYGFGIRGLYDFRKIFLGGSVFLGVETSFLSSLGFEYTEDKFNYNRLNYFLVAPVLEQNYKWLRNSFQMANGIAFYNGIQRFNKNAFGLITNIGWFPIYRGKAITPYITYRNDWVFDKKTNMESISLGVNF
ncbi:MAG TPA: hypothetical protein VII99_12740 [Bacteroidia bacterium]